MTLLIFKHILIINNLNNIKYKNIMDRNVNIFVFPL